MALPFLRELPGAPDLGQLPDDSLGELVVLGLSDSQGVKVAHIAVHVTTADTSIEWLSKMNFEAFLECMPTWPLLNVPFAPPDSPIRKARRPKRQTATRPKSPPKGELLASAWRSRGRPVQATDALLLSAIQLIPDQSAVLYLEVIRRLRTGKFDQASRTMIADMCDFIAHVQELPDVE